MPLLHASRTRHLVILTSILFVQLSTQVAYSDESQFSKLKTFLSESRQELGCAPHWFDLYRFANKNGIDIFNSITPEETAAIVEEMKAAHKELVVTKNELFSILKAQRQAIQSWQATAHIRREFKTDSILPRLPVEQTSRFATSDGRFLMETTKVATKENTDIYNLLTCADGVQRHLGTKPLGRLALKLKQPATIEPLTQDPTLSFYFQPGNIVSEALLFDSERAGLPKEAGAIDIMQVEPIAFVLEGEHDIGGDKCVCLMTPISSFYFDSKHGFAVRRIERLPRMHVTDIEFSQENTGSIDRGDGIWLPTKATKIWFNAKNPEVFELHETIEYSEVSVNQPLPESMYTDIVPAGALVTDVTRDLCYIAGEKGEIAKMISAVTPIAQEPVKKGNSRWVIIGANMVMLTGVAAFATWRKHKSQHA